mgnify:FL=1
MDLKSQLQGLGGMVLNPIASLKSSHAQSCIFKTLPYGVIKV